MLELDDKIRVDGARVVSPRRSSSPSTPNSTIARSPRRTGRRGPPPRRGKIWLAVWPKVAAVAIALGIWQLVVLSGWRPEYVLPAPATVFDRLGELIADGTVFDALQVTGERALVRLRARRSSSASSSARSSPRRRSSARRSDR